LTNSLENAMDIREKVRLQYTALLTGDVALAVATTAVDWSNDEAEGEPPACRIPGPAGLLATGAWMRSAFSDLRFVEHVSVADEHHVLSEITLSGTHTGPFTVFEDGRLAQVLPPTGRAFAVRQVHVHRLRGDEIVGHAAVRDDLGMLTQIGAFPPDPKLLARAALWRMTGRAARAGREAIARAEAAAAEAERTPLPAGS
jgi:SnoaL-like polyketide cyclase